MEPRLSGHYEISNAYGEKVKAFIPDPLPPKRGLVIEAELRQKMERAVLALGRLDSITLLLPETDFFLYAYVRKEAVLSSQIEGTQSSLSDLLLFELEAAPGVPMDDVQEVSNYVAAMKWGLKRVQEDFPLSMRLLCEMHAILLGKGRGSSKKPGEVRTSQNWIGGTRPGNAVYVPPPPHSLGECLGPWERFLHDQPEPTEVLVKAALAHVQFETIHPFLDGNGRLGRLLITLIFCKEKVLREPMLYLSLYLKKHRTRYYDLLQKVRIEGAWTEWLTFFSEAVEETANQAVDTARNLTAMADFDRKEIQGIGRLAGSALRVHEAFLVRPVMSIQAACTATKLVPNTVIRAMDKLAHVGILREITGKKRNRVFIYQKYIKLIEDGAERREKK